MDLFGLLFREHEYNKRVVNNELIESCRVGNYKSVLAIIEKGATEFNSGLAAACCGGHENIALLMIEKGANNFDLGLSNACACGRKELAQLMIEKGATKLNLGLANACQNNYEELALLMVENGATDLNWGLVESNKYWRLSLLMIEKGADIDMCLYTLKNMHLEYLLHKNVTNFGNYKSRVKNIRNSIKLKKQMLSVFLYPDLANKIITY